MNLIKAVDIKQEFWFQIENVENYFSLDMKDIEIVEKLQILIMCLTWLVIWGVRSSKIMLSVCNLY